MNQFNEYPKLMKHPGHRPAQWKKLEGKGVGLFSPDTVMTAAELFADVTVSTLDQEKQYAARGYRPSGIADPEQYEQAFLESSPNGYIFQEFPKMKYHALQAPVIVNDKQEEKALGAGWHDMPVEATEDDFIAAESQNDETNQVAAELESSEKLDKRSKAYRNSLKAQHA